MSTVGKSYFEESALKANTENGKDWLRKALHPPGAKGTSYNGYPDKSVIPAIHQEYRLDWEGFLPSLDDNKSMLLLHCPSFINLLFHAGYTQSYPLGNDNVWQLAQSNDQVSQISVAGEMGKVQAAYMSETLQYDATGFNNSGMVYSAQFSPSVYTLNLTTVIRKLHKQGVLDKFMPEFVKAFGEDMKTAHKLITQKIKRVSTDDFEMINDNDFWNVGQPLPITTQMVQIVQLGRPITQPTDISMLSPKKYTARSTEGAFIVHQTNEDFNKWCSVRTGTFVNGSSFVSKPLIVCCYETVDDNGIAYLFPFRDGGGLVFDVEWPNWTWAYTLFTGMQPGAAGGSPPQVNIKTIRGIAIAPTPRSILNASTVSPALYDPQALQTYSVITQSRQDAMPAEYNMLGSLLGGSGIAVPLMSSTISSISDAITGADAPKAEKKKVSAELAEDKATENNESLGETNTTKKSITATSRPRRQSYRRPREPKPKPLVIYRDRSSSKRRVRSISRPRPSSRKRSSSRKTTGRKYKNKNNKRRNNK